MSSDKILRTLDTRMAVELTKRLVRAPSINPPGNESLAAEVVLDFLDEIGVKHVTQRVSDERCNVIATLRGRTSSRSFLLTSHLDVVPPGDEKLWCRDPFSGLEENGLIHGRGSTDAKGSLGAMLSALQAVVESGIALSGDLVFAAVVGEETTGLGIKHLIQKHGLRPSMALVGEPTQLRVANAHKGIARFRIHARGKAAHASLPDRGVNAISRMARIVLGLEDLASKLRGKKDAGYPTLVVSTIAGGVKDNVVPPDCYITVDRRLVVGEDIRKAESEIAEVANSAVAGSALKVDVVSYLSAPPAETSADEPIVQFARSAVSKVLGVDKGVCSFEAHSDMGPLVDLAGTKTAILGPGSLEGSHVANEVISVEEVVQAAKIYSLTVAHALGT